MKSWPTIVLVVCAAAIATAEWLTPSAMRGVLGGLLFGLVVLTALSQHSALRATIQSLKAAHREQLDSERRYRALFDACSDAIFVFPVEGGAPGPFVEVNAAACVSLGYDRQELMAMTLENISAPEVRRDIVGRSATLLEARSSIFETVQLSGNGQRLPVEISTRPVEIRGHRLCLAIARNIAARKEEEELLRSMVHEDKLTGLLNRRGFFAMVEQAAPRAQWRDARLLLMYVDVDGLKQVNDKLGHAAGDAVLVAAAETLRATFRAEDVLARIGGDEFVALALLGEDEQLEQQALSARLARAVSAKHAELGEDYAFSLSFGGLVASWEELGRIEELLARSDERMYEAKRARRRESRPAGV